MQRKIHNFYVRPVDNKLCLHVIEMITNDNASALGRMTKIGLFASYADIDFVVDAIYDGSYIALPPFNGVDMEVVDEFNHLPGNREDNREQLRTQLKNIFQYRFGIINYIINSYARMNNLEDQQAAHALGFLRYDHETATDYYHPNDEYTLANIILPLPSNPEVLLKLLGALEDVLHSATNQAKRNDFKTNIVYCENLPDFSQPQMIVANTVNELKISGQKDLPSPVRFVAGQIIKAVADQPERFKAYEPAAQELVELLKTESDSLARSIREKLYPDPSIEDFLQKTLPNDTLTCTLLNPKSSYTDATGKLMNELSNKLKCRVAKYEDKGYIEQWILWVKEIWNQTEYVNTSETSKEAIRTSIKVQFERLIETRNALWEQTVESLFARKAPDGGNYHSEYTEVDLLKDAHMHLNSDGLMELDIYHTKSYKKNYALGKHLYDKLEEELRAACSQLFLDILPSDFHKKIVFSRESTIELMNRGMHYTEDYAKALMRTSHRFRLFTSIEKQRNDLQKLPLDLQARILQEAAFKDKAGEVEIEIGPDAREGEAKALPARRSELNNNEVRLMRNR